MKTNTLSAILILSTSFLWAKEPPRIEKDLLGEKKIPADALYGVQTMRAVENFPISGDLISKHPNFIKGFAIVKLAAARANTDVGKMKPEVRDKIELAYKALMAGEYHDQFVVDMYQGGAGTSTNMNANEVMANIALLKSGHKIGEYSVVEPHDDLNMSQSTNDSYPSALKMAMILNNAEVLKELEALIASFRTLGNKYIDVLKMGRTELQDAVPMTVGQEFHAYATALQWEHDLLVAAEKHLYGMNMGATAIGTGLNTLPGYSEKCVKHMAELSGKKIYKLDDLIAGTWDMQSFLAYSSALKSLSVKLAKISSDLRILASGPRTGFYEINLPALQPGSSIMPGKVNPVIPELMSVISFRVMANDLAVTFAAENGDLQLNAFEPLIAISVFESQKILTSGLSTFRSKCIDGITINEQVLAMHIERSIGIVTALNPVVGYEKATELAKEALEQDKGILEIIREKKILSEEEIKKILDPATMTGLDKSKYPKK
ncbi:aspartate ammonia-lyase [Rubritalea tangerina]|uniref:Aspartate ammonia-lyase n=1 Tax=Rubritalea tangerina TaxID=430798 RepID=A0ABW4Z8D3_9BACT